MPSPLPAGRHNQTIHAPNCPKPQGKRRCGSSNHILIICAPCHSTPKTSQQTSCQKPYHKIHRERNCACHPCTPRGMSQQPLIYSHIFALPFHTKAAPALMKISQQHRSCMLSISVNIFNAAKIRRSIPFLYFLLSASFL